MQEEVENRTVNLAISTTKLTARGTAGSERTCVYQAEVPGIGAEA